MSTDRYRDAHAPQPPTTQPARPMLSPLGQALALATLEEAATQRAALLDALRRFRRLAFDAVDRASLAQVNAWPEAMNALAAIYQDCDALLPREGEQAPEVLTIEKTRGTGPWPLPAEPVVDSELTCHVCGAAWGTRHSETCRNVPPPRVTP